MSTITVAFTSNYAGPHRVCWRIGSSGAYDCSTVVNCAGSGDSCQAVIDVGTLDNETCDEIEFEGYVQSMCEDISSEDGRVPFTVTFTPDPACNRYTVTCANVGIASFTVLSGGSGYDPFNPPVVTISGGGGSGAAGVAVVTGDAVTSITLTNAGSGYTSIPTVTIAAPSPGVQATASAVLEDCPEFLGSDCTAPSPAPTVGELSLGESIAICKSSALSLSSQFDVEETGNCLCNCTQYTVSNNGLSPADITIQYTACDGAFVEQVLEPGNSVDQICMVTGSLLIIPNPGAIYTSITGAACPGA
jgi:hypothetical protein